MASTPVRHAVAPRRLGWDGHLTLVRHGETDFNVQGRFLGVLDEPLNEKGLDQARQAAAWIERWASTEGVAFKTLLSSPLRRCMQTARVFARTFALDIQAEPLFVERNYGAFEGMRKTDVATRYPGEYAAYQARKATTRPPGDGAEVIADVEERIERFLAGVLPRAHAGSREIIIVTHLNPVRAFYRLLGLAGEEIYYTEFSNASLSRIRVERDGACSFEFCDEDPGKA